MPAALPPRPPLRTPALAFVLGAVLSVASGELPEARAAVAPGDAASPLAGYAALRASPEGTRLLAIARRAMEAHFSGREGEAPADTLATPDWPGPPVAIYVSLVDGPATRACVGSPLPLRGTLARSVEALAVEALRADRRRPPVREEELDRLRIVLSFAGEGETVAEPMEVDPGSEGLLVTSSRGSIAFLPGEARTVSWALREARRAGVLAGSPRDAAFRRFPVVTLEEPAAGPRPGRDSGKARGMESETESGTGSGKETPDDAP